MTTSQLKQSVKRQIDGLSERRLQSAADFLKYLQELESEEATEELMRIPGLLEAHRRGMCDIEAGRTVPLSKLKRKPKRV
jgi:hypothetical protein